MTIAIIKYGMGNVASVQKVLKKLGYNSIITNYAEDIRNADLILLPGVGSFKKGMENLKQYGLIEVLNEEVLNKKKPFIGICLGMQLLATYGNEPTKEDAWKIQSEDIGELVVDLLKMNPRTLPSKIEVRPSKPPKK